MEELLRTGSGLPDFERFLLEHKEKREYIADFLLIFLRDCLLVQLGLEKQVLCRDRLTEIRALGAALSKRRLTAATDSVLRYMRRTAANANASASALELLMSIRGETNDKGNGSPV